MGFIATPEVFMEKVGFTLKPCVRCGSDDLYAYDCSLDECFVIRCNKCGANDVGSFIESSGKRWNKAMSISDLVSWYPTQPEYKI